MKKRCGYLLLSVSPTVLGIGFSAAGAQTLTPAQETAREATVSAGQESADASPTISKVETIIVTGSRIVRNGYQAPTPVTVVSTAQLQQAAPSNIPDALNQLPQFEGSRGQSGGSTPLTNANQPRSGNYLNLRNLGFNRSLVLLDGRRVPPTTFEGAVDLNSLPQSLIQRVDVVTAGASAVYGADAISGVINFVLDKNFDGIKGSLQRGISSYGDNANVRASIAAGTSLFDGKAHLEGSYDYFDSDGISRKDARSTIRSRSFLSGTGTAADPYRVTADGKTINGTLGGVIVNVRNANGTANTAGSSLLNNLQFNSATSFAPLQLGAATGTSSVRQGGDGYTGYPDTSLLASLRTHQAFGRFSYELAPAVEFFTQGDFAYSDNRYTNGYDLRNGGAGLTIYSGNPFLPTAVQNTLTTTGADNFVLGRMLHDLGVYATRTVNKSYNATAGLNGNFSLLGDWKWEAYYTHGWAQLKTAQSQTINRNLYAALDAVRAPNGSIVCRVTLVNPTLLPGCVPLNVLGNGTPSAQAVSFVTGQSRFTTTNKLDEWAGNISGAPFSTWAGPVSVSIAVDYRRQSLRQISNGDPAQIIDYTGIRGQTTTTPFSFTNVGLANGRNSVIEANGEFVVPVIKDASFTKLLELNGAGRYTHYSTSGTVYTWKLGVTWEPFSGLRFRSTRSRDIRAPTLYELFAGAQINPNQFTDTHSTPATTGAVITRSGGNLGLKPEVGNTLTGGFIFQPHFFEGFSISVDYYRLKITNAISSLTLNNVRDQCETSGGTDPLCQYIVRPLPFSNRTAANFPLEVNAPVINLASVKTHGIDVETQYRRDLTGLGGGLSGMLTLRGLMTYAPFYQTFSGIGARRFQLGGVVGYPKIRSTLSATYSNGGLDAFVQARIIGRVKRDTPENNGFVYLNNRVPSVTYFDTTLSYDIKVGDRHLTPFMTINNLLNKKPPLIPTTFIPGVLNPTDASTYDVIGRMFTVGVRFRL